ncbi:hypothetical protein DDZ18_05745 [Marinicauda salina]|uniref:DNA-binding transcriptional regulator NtrC n=1 Tax=Marinicauda salina TaxID=2135793 RepID=A0A2U2BT83_9PROT|nr:response regulator [Marinicauda salina]PWE17196.1 hypothetical protein DDZ18_05745 [Marinicauda salina]
MSRRIQLLEDDDSLRLVISRALSRAGYEVRATASPDAAIDRMARGDADLLIADVLLGRENFLERLQEVRAARPNAPVIVISAQTTAATAIRAEQGGAVEYLPKPFDLEDLAAAVERALGTAGETKRSGADPFAMLAGRSPAMQEAFRAIARLAPRREPVVFSGPDGSGRAAAARALYAASERDGMLREAGPAALDDDFAGVFEGLGADDAVLLRRAEAWTPKTQARLLERLEASGAGPRILATVSPDAGRVVRPDLMDRLGVGHVDLPPLHERGDDVLLLFRRFFEAGAGRPPELEAAAERYLRSRVWPGEVRELERAARRLAAQGGPGAVTLEAVKAAIATPGEAAADEAIETAAMRYAANLLEADETDIAEHVRAAAERGMIRAALAATGGVRREAADRLGLNRNTLARRIAALGLDEESED